jgi:hypothetical protein
MVVTVGGKGYVIEGIAYGKVPAWKLIKQQDGTPMTHELFDRLPDADKRALAEYVQRHVNGLQGR